MLRPDVIFGSELVGSLAAELVLMPVLYLWLARIANSRTRNPARLPVH